MPGRLSVLLQHVSFWQRGTIYYFYEGEINNNIMNHLVDYLRFWHKQDREKHRIDKASRQKCCKEHTNKDSFLT